MQKLITLAKFVLWLGVVLAVWALALGFCIVIAEAVSPGDKLVQTILALVSLVALALVVRRGYRRTWKETGKRGKRAARGKPGHATTRPKAKRRRGLDELHETSFGDDGFTVSEVTPRYWSFADDLPTHRKWAGAKRVRVRDITLDQPLAFTSTEKVESCPGTICLGAEVASRGEVYDEELSYWPRYADLSPRGRRGYLLWLADGARTAAVSISYVFLYFYGLEQRAVGDRRDLGKVREELLRLHDLFGSNRSFHGYASALVGMTHLLEGSEPGTSLARLADRGPAKLPLPFLEILSTCWPENRWPVEYVLELLKHHGSNTIVQKRVWEKLEELFRLRFEEKYPSGLEPPKNAKRHRGPYRWAANTGVKHVEFPHAEITAFGKKWNALERLWSEVTAELKPYASAAGRKALSEGALYQQLPAELRTGDHPEQKAWQEWFDREADEQELCLTTWGTLAALSPSIVPKEGKLTPRLCRDTAALCDSVGLAMEPDPRVGRGSSRELSEPLLVYRPAAGEVTAPDEHHDALTLMIELCVGVAEVDGEVSDDEIDQIINHIDRHDRIGAAERERLLACVAFFHRTGAGLQRATKARLGKLPIAVREALAHLVVLVALADGVVTPGEEKALTKVYRALDLPLAELEGVLRPHREPEVEEEEAPEAAEAPRIAIDWERVSAITIDTRDVQALLHEALAGAESVEEESAVPEIADEPDAEIPAAETVIAGTASLPGALDDRAAELVHWLRARPAGTIDPAEWDEQCKSRGLMAAMAIDMINEWADEELGEYLVEGDGPYTLNRDLL